MMYMLTHIILRMIVLLAMPESIPIILQLPPLLSLLYLLKLKACTGCVQEYFRSN